MASARTEMFANIAESMKGRGETPSASPAGASSLERQSEGRRRLESAAVIRIDRIIADPDQPRTEFDPEDLGRLAESLKDRGQLQPIRVRWDEASGRYVVVVGERRWRAAQLAGLETLACVVAQGAPSPEDILEDQLVENCLRIDLKPIEQAKAYRRLLQSRGLNQRQLAERLRIDNTAITRALALLELPEALQARVEDGTLPPATAYEITKAGAPEAVELVAAEVLKSGLTRAETAERVRKVAGSSKGRKAREKPPRPRVFRLAGVGKVTVEPGKPGADPLAMIQEVARILAAERSVETAA